MKNKFMKLLIIILTSSLLLVGCTCTECPVGAGVDLEAANKEIAELEAEVERVQNIKAKKCVDLQDNIVELKVKDINKYITSDGTELCPCK